MHFQDLKVKCKALKNENSKLVSILYSKDSQMKILESQLQALEQKFLYYRDACERFLNEQPINSELVEKSIFLVNSIKINSDLMRIGQPLGIEKLKKYVTTNKLQKALKISLQMNLELSNRHRLPKTYKHQSITEESLNEKSEYLLQSINQQFKKVTKMIKRPENSTPRIFRR